MCGTGPVFKEHQQRAVASPGRYVARESATHEGDTAVAGFSTRQVGIDIAARLEDWQRANDERMWKLIVSPEFGDRVDLKRLTRYLMSEMQRDLGTPLEWMAVPTESQTRNWKLQSWAQV